MTGTFPLDVAVLLSVLNHLSLGVYITDRKRRILLWNRKAEQITGYRAEQIVGRACHEDILVHVDKDNHRLCTTRLCPLHRSITLGKESQEPVLIYAKKAGGRRVAVSVSTAPLRDAAGNIIGGIEVFRDETDQIRDMELARRIQQRLLPQALPEIPNYRFDARYYPHDLVGGDLYDLRRLAPGLFGFLIADVRGHGVSAALYTMWLKSIEENLIGQAKGPARFMNAMARELKKFVVEESFATAIYGVLNVRRSEVTYTNAGHPAPLHYRAALGEVVPLQVHGVPLGILDRTEYQADTTILKPGDLLLCYTDGLTDSMDRDGQRMGQPGLIALLKEELRRPVPQLLERVYRRVKQQCGNVTLSDDVLLFSIRRQTRRRGHTAPRRGGAGQDQERA